MKKQLLFFLGVCVFVFTANAQNWKGTTTEWRYDFQGVRNPEPVGNGSDIVSGNDIQLQLPMTSPYGGSYVSTGVLPGWLPAPAIGESTEIKIYTTNDENAQYTLKRTNDGSGLKVNSMDVLLSKSANNNKFILRDMSGATGVAKFSTHFKIHYPKGSIALANEDTKGSNIWFVLGTNASSGYFQAVNTMQYNAPSAGQISSVFAAFSFGYIKNQDYFKLTIKSPVDGTRISDTYGGNPGIGSTIKIEGGDYLMDVYCNNSSIDQTYTLGGADKTIAAKTFHLIINGVFIGAYQGVFSGVPTDAPLNGFVMEAKGAGAISTTTNQGASIELMKDITVSYLPINTQEPQRFVGFNSSIPSNWSTTGSVSLLLSNEHDKEGGKSLKWTAGSGAQLKAVNLNIPSSEIGNATSGIAQMYIYSQEVSQDTLIFQFFDDLGNKQREGRMLLNFKGWRDYHRSYYYDYNNGTGTSAGFPLNQFVIVYKPQNPTITKTIYIDAVKFVGDTEVRMPGPHMVLDYHHYRKNNVNGQNGNALAAWLHQADIPLLSPTAQELTDLNVVRSRYSRTVANVTPTELNEAKAYVNFSNIHYNPDNTITGRGIYDIHQADTFVRLSKYVGYLAKAYRKNGDEDAKTKLIEFTKYILDQGLAEGGRNVLRTNSYANPLAFPLGFIDALPVYPEDVRVEVVKLLKWSNMFNIVHENTYVPGYNVDYLYLKGKFLPELAVLEEDDAVAVRDLKAVKRFLERNTEVGYGARDGIKPDGTGYHHQSNHMSYMYAWGEWVNIASKFKGTGFKVSKQSYDNMVFAVKNLFLRTSKGTLFSHAESGRTPFQNSVSVKLAQLRALVEIGGDISGTPIDDSLAAFYNYLTGTTSYYSSVSPINDDGFYAYAYGAMAVKRNNNYVAVMRGLTNKIFGSEINAGDNRWGRYQSYGSVEILYGGNLSSSGYLQNGVGWDWNVMPGTTTVHFPNYTGLLALKPTSTEFQLESFAGGLSLGKEGVFGLDFSQDAKTYYATSNLKFRKSVFAFDDVLVCLGSNISTSNSLGNVATNLFQAVNSGSNPAIYINSATPVSGTYNGTLSTSSSGAWFLTSQKTGYYIPKGNGDITVFRGSQSTPLESSDNATITGTANVSKAWINHGTQPTGGKYNYVIVPDVTATGMQNTILQIDSGLLYEILNHSETTHIVKYLPKKLTSYVFFQPQANVNIGYIKSISNKAMVGVREVNSIIDGKDSLIVTLSVPDLNTENKTSWDYYWLARPSTVSITLDGEWDIAENINNATITKNGIDITATFVLEHGFSNTIKLVREGVSDKPGKWVSDSDSLIYDLGSGTGNQGASWINGVSTSTVSAPGFLPYPSAGTGRVSSSTGSPRFDLEGSGESAGLKITASSQGTIGKFSLFNTGASAVTALFFNMSFNTEPNNGTWLMAIGNHVVSHDSFNRFNDGSGVPGNAERAEIFSALRWTIGAGNSIDFAYRQKSGSTISYATVSGAPFVKGGTYSIEVYCNNSDDEQEYIRSSRNYSVDAGTLHVWVDGIHLGVFPASELERKKELTAFLFTGNNSNLPANNSAQLTLSNIQLHYVKHVALPITVTSFTGNYKHGGAVLNWSTVVEKNVDQFKIYRSIDGVDYPFAGSVLAVGNSEQENYYSFTDRFLPKNNQHFYYKMIALDRDGKQSYASDTIAIEMPLTKETFKIIPNPVKDHMELRFFSSVKGDVYIKITSTDGKLVYNKKILADKGSNSVIIEVSHLIASGYVTILQGVVKEQGFFVKY